MPINLQTINAFYGLDLSPAEAESFIKSEVDKEQIRNPTNLEEKAISLIGKPLYEAFIKGYTEKHWGTDPKNLPAGIITRLPVRFTYKSDYFDDPWQGIPIEGYGELFKNILAHRNIDLHLDTDFFKIRHFLIGLGSIPSLEHIEEINIKPTKTAKELRLKIWLAKE